ncbi:MAG TPA: lamin tail domain-containing protein [Candidatus Limnocylindria bacterium]|nr:lamin tail domain-containing protein [Candidatus Limnocylindria bacterium]
MPGSSIARVLIAIAAVASIIGSVLPLSPVSAVGAPDHLVVSEIVTGGASASDEMIELYNPTAASLPLEGLELIYVSSSGATVTRRAAWSVGAPGVPSGAHVLVANEAGIYASVADAVYATGMAATGGSVALRISGASSAIDAVGWGTAASTWREGANAAAPAAGASIERLPGGALGSAQDTDDNAADFIERAMPEPQNLASPPTPDAGTPTDTPTPSTTPIPTAAPTGTPVPTVVPTVEPTPTATPSAVVSVADARAADDGATVTIEATALTASDFHDGGGFVADASGGIAIIVEDGVTARGERLRITGEVDDRFSQRTLRTVAADVVALGPGVEPEPVVVVTGSVDEALEGRLASVAGTLVGSSSTLTTGTAFDLDDGSGVVRVVVQAAAGIDLAAWRPGASIELVGVVGQRDSTGTGVEGYRVMPRDGDDVTFVADPETPTPSPSPSTEATPMPSSNPEGVLTVAAVRDAAKNARLRTRGVVTLASGVIDGQTAVIQDATGAIVLRLSDEAGAVALGEWIEVAGTRSTKGGMETLRVTDAPSRLGTAPPPAAQTVRTGQAGEAQEARLVVAAGAIVATARQASSGSVSFEIDDGSGPLRVSVGASLGANDESWTSGTWVRVSGVLGQETTGAQPLRGYRIWPRTIDDVRVVAGATDAGSTEAGDDPGASGGLDAVGGADLSGTRVAATLVAGRWPELGIAGLLWDGSRLVAISEESAGAVSSVRGSRSLPLALELGGLSSSGTEPTTGASLVTLGTAAGELLIGSGPAAAPRSSLTGERPAWVSLVGRLEQGGTMLRLSTERVPVERQCDGQGGGPTAGTVAVLGVAADDPVRVIVPCGGITPGPAVALSGSLGRPSGPAPASDDAMLAAARQVPYSTTRRTLVAALLALGALLLGGTAAWRWRRDEPPMADEAVATGGDEPRPAPGTARLTLVRLPREHGP